MLRRFSPTSIGRWSVRRPWLAIAVWLAFVVSAVLALSLTGTKQLQNGATGESARGYALMDAHQLGLPPVQFAYVHSESLSAGAPAFRAATRSAAVAMRTALGGPVTLGVSRDQHSVLISGQVRMLFSLPGLQRSLAAVHAGDARVSVALGGSGDSGSGKDLSRAERLSVPITLLVLLIAFGALVAALVPVLLAVTAVIAAFGLLGPISQLFPLDDSVKTVVLLIGMAVGVDYALFYVVRSREERQRGHSSREALERTARTSGRSV